MTPTPTKSAMPTWGQPIAARSGFSITVTFVGPMPATKFVDDGVGHHYSGRTAVFKTTVHNGTTGPIETALLVIGQPSLFAGPDGDIVGKAPNNWDSNTQGIPGTPTLQPGQSYSWEWGFDDATGFKDLHIQYQANLPQYQGGPQAMEWAGDIP